MLMLLYADDLVLLAPSRSDLTTAPRWGAGQGAPEEVVLSRAGLQIPQGKYALLQEGGAGRQAQVL